MLKLTKKNESGRSMIEMLGVLATIGLLSVGGISGYTVAMKNHEANEAVNQARQLAMMAASKRALNPNAFVTGNEINGKYNFAMDDQETGKIKLTVSGLAPDVAKRVEDMNLGIAKVELKDSTAETGKKDVVFTFKNDLSEFSESTSGTAGDQGQGEPTVEDPQTETNICAAYTGTASSYTGGFAGKATDTTTDCNCPSGNIWDNGACRSYTCENELSDPDACLDHQACGDLEHGAWVDGICYGAGDSYCPHTKFGKTVCNKAVGCGWVDGACHSCDTDYPEACLTSYECASAGSWINDACYGYDENYCPLTKYGESVCNAASGCGWINGACVPCDTDHPGACMASDECSNVGGIWILDACYPMKENGCPATSTKAICEDDASGCFLVGNDCVPPSF